MAEIIDVVMRLTDNVTEGLHHIRTEMEQTARANSQMGRNLTNAGKGVGALSSAMMPLAAGIAGVGGIGVQTFMDFDATITGAGVKAGATAEEMQKMKDAASQMGAQFPTTARDVAEGMDRLAAGGFNAEQTIGAMPGIIEASIASGEDLATTSDVVTSALYLEHDGGRCSSQYGPCRRCCAGRSKCVEARHGGFWPGHAVCRCASCRTRRQHRRARHSHGHYVEQRH